MITLKTVNEKTFNEPFGVQKPITKHIYLKIDRPMFIGNLISVEGYYYYLNDDDEPIKLRNISMTPINKDTLHQLQSNVIPPAGTELIYDLMEYLMEKIAILTLQQEAQALPGGNWGITGNGDIELYVEQQQE